ncbi:MAG: right-handed parallel beta-helix repeat-containing protein [Planctomycetia bacterium]|nr:right-handed parallel beta-helix repeat-containing protein [Planctomycetia bacterium]
MKLTSWLQRVKMESAKRKSRRLKNAVPLITTESLEPRQVMTAAPLQLWVATSGGDDFTGNGSLNKPYQSVTRALDAGFAQYNTTSPQSETVINLRSGEYLGGFTVMYPGVTIESAPGEWGVISTPTNDPTLPFGIRYYPDAGHAKLLNLEIEGGYYYAVKTEEAYDWGKPTKYGTQGLLIDHCKLHDSGVDVVKLVAGSDDVVIRNSEIYNSGRRLTQSADGIDNLNSDRMIVEDNYIHDIASNGILTSAGSIGCLIQRNEIERTAYAGINLGYYSEQEWMDWDVNHPGIYSNSVNSQLFTSIDNVARNNVIVDAGMAGIGIYGSLRPQVQNNTIINAATQAQAPILFAPIDIWVRNEKYAYAIAQLGSNPHTPLPKLDDGTAAGAQLDAAGNLPNGPGYLHVYTIGALVENNIVTVKSDNLTRLVDIRPQSYLGTQTIDYNRYFDEKMTRQYLFINRNPMDGVPEETFPQWQQNEGFDLHSTLGNPSLNNAPNSNHPNDYHLTAGSAAIDTGALVPAVLVADDYDTQPRVGAPDIGADEFNNGAIRSMPSATFGATTFEVVAPFNHPWTNLLENSGAVTMTVRRNGDLHGSASVDYYTVDQTAVVGSDYVSTRGTLNFADGQATATISVPIINDNVVEGDEVFQIKIANPQSQNLLGTRLSKSDTLNVNIDEDQAPIPTNYRTLVVSNTGNDKTGDGSVTHPWFTLQHAADAVQPGDYVIVKAGNYWGFQVTTSGKADARIVFHAEPGVLIDKQNSVTADGINLEGADYVTVEGFTVNNMARTGIRSVLNTGVEIRNNHLDHNGMWGILTGFSENLLIENNVASNSVQQHGIYVSNSADNPIVRNNVTFGNRDCGIQLNGDADQGGDGIISHALLEGNVIYDNGLGGGGGFNLDGVQDSVIRNNLLYGNHAGGIVLFWQDAGGASKNNLVENNTVIQANNSRSAMVVDSSPGNRLINNIFYNPSTYKGSIAIDAASSVGFSSDYNIVDDKLVGPTGWQNQTLSQWQQKTGQDLHSIVANPTTLFVDAAHNDYHLAANSPAINKGTVWPPDPRFPMGPTHVDIYQHARPQGAGVDIGAFETTPSGIIPCIKFSSADFMAYDYSGMAVVEVDRLEDTEGTTTVDYATTGGDAPTADYTPVTGTLTFAPGETHKEFQVFVGNHATNHHETIGLTLNNVSDTLHNPPGYHNPPGVATLHLITDTYGREGTFNFSTEVFGAEEKNSSVLITVYRTGGSAGETSVDFATQFFVSPQKPTWYPPHWLQNHHLPSVTGDAAATRGADFQIVTGTLNFADGEVIKTFSIPLVNDNFYEGEEAITLQLSNVTGGAKLGQQAMSYVAIHDDETPMPGTFNLSAATYSVNEGAGTLSFTVSRDVGNMAASVIVATTDGAVGKLSNQIAYGLSDFGLLSANGALTLNFAPGELTKTLTISIVDDKKVESTEYFTIGLRSPTNGAKLGTIESAIVSIIDNDTVIPPTTSSLKKTTAADGLFSNYGTQLASGLSL